MKTMLFTLTSLFILTGCEQHYRYFCHDPSNWDDQRCKAPVCEVNKDCPSHIFKNSQTDIPKSSQENKK